MSEENLAIIKKFLEDAPPGEYEQCSAALQAVVTPEDAGLISQARSETLKSWSEKACRAVEVDGHNAIICPEALQEDGTYVDPITLKTFEYDFESREAKVTENTVEGSEFRGELQKELIDYAIGAYKENPVVGVFDKADGSLAIVLGSQSISLNNFRTGKTVAKYTLTQDGNLTGKIESIQHFFEKGNAVCQNDDECNVSTKFGNAKEVIKAIKAFEDKWLTDYKETLARIGEEIIFRLRRKFPISKTKINWENEIHGIGGMNVKK